MSRLFASLQGNFISSEPYILVLRHSSSPMHSNTHVRTSMHGRARSVCGTGRTDGQTDKGSDGGRGMRIGVRGRFRGDANDAVTTALLLTAAASSLKKGRTDGRTSTPHCVRWMARILRIGGRGEDGRAQISHICAATAPQEGGERGGRRQWDCSKNGVGGRLFEVEGERRRGTWEGSRVLFFWNLIRICVVGA